MSTNGEIVDHLSGLTNHVARSKIRHQGMPAYVMRQEQETGSLEVGKQADLIVLDQNIFDVPTDKISKTKVLMTFLAGNRITKVNNQFSFAKHLNLVK